MHGMAVAGGASKLRRPAPATTTDSKDASTTNAVADTGDNRQTASLLE